MRKTIFIACCTLSMAAFAAPRSEQQMRAIALSAMRQNTPCSIAIEAQSAPGETLQVAERRSALAVYIDGQGAFAVVAADDNSPALLGYGSDASMNNPGYRWWLESVNAAATRAAAENRSLKVVKPNGDKYATSVEPLLTTAWGQEGPYNDLCPVATGERRCLTGCVATSIAQVLYYHHGPKHGKGRRTIYYPQNDPSGTAITVDFENALYDWDNMLADYRSTDYTPEQAAAVATLMRDVGVAVDMNYGAEASGTNHGNAAQGLRAYYGIETATKYDRTAYSEAAWMDLIYRSISDGNPVVYGGLDAMSGGHSFVFDGYTADGLVHVNWGWYGEDNGYFYVADLDPYHNGTAYEFNQAQDIIIGIVPDAAEGLLSADVTTSEAGTLASYLDLGNIFNYGSLRVTGYLNGADFKIIRAMAGRDEAGNATEGRLQQLDLSEANICASADVYLSENGTDYTTADGTLPYKAFYGTSLNSLKCPASATSIADGVFGLMTNLKELSLPDDGDFCIDGNVIFTADRSEVIAVKPFASGMIELPIGTTAIHPFAMAGCQNVKNLKLASTVQSIGSRALADCLNLVSIKTYSKTAPDLATDALNGVDLSGLRVYVPRDCADVFTAAEGWNQIAASKFVEFGTTIRARNATREQGKENPQFSYQVEGDYVDGTAQLTCDATPESPVGRYRIVVSAGTITEEGVEFVDGWLIVTAASGINDAKVATTCDVYNLQGHLVLQNATDEDLATLQPGLYIKRQGSETTKILIP